MHSEINRLDLLPLDSSAQITKVTAEEPLLHRLTDLGFVEGTIVHCVLRKAHGDSAAFLIRNTVIALRKEDSAKIHIIPLQK